MSKQTILVIDDDENQLAVMATFLERQGYAVVSACSAEEGLGVLDQHAVDAAVCDVMLPRKSGKWFLESVRRSVKFAALPVLMVTAAREDMMQELLDAGANGFLAKRDLLKNLAPALVTALNKGGSR